MISNTLPRCKGDYTHGEKLLHSNYFRKVNMNLWLCLPLVLQHPLPSATTTAITLRAPWGQRQSVSSTWTEGVAQSIFEWITNHLLIINYIWGTRSDTKLNMVWTHSMNAIKTYNQQRVLWPLKTDQPLTPLQTLWKAEDGRASSEVTISTPRRNRIQ